MSLEILEENLRREVGESQRFSDSCWSPMHLLFRHLCADGPGQSVKQESGNGAVRVGDGSDNQSEIPPQPVDRCGKADNPPGDGGVDKESVPVERYYWQKYEVLDGEAEYTLQSVRSVWASDEPQTYEAWMRELIEFAAYSSGEEPWSEERIQQFLKSDDPVLEVDDGLRIYRNFHMQEITKAEYEVLRKYL